MSQWQVRVVQVLPNGATPPLEFPREHEVAYVWEMAWWVTGGSLLAKDCQRARKFE